MMWVAGSLLPHHSIAGLSTYWSFRLRICFWLLYELENSLFALTGRV